MFHSRCDLREACVNISTFYFRPVVIFVIFSIHHSLSTLCWLWAVRAPRQIFAVEQKLCYGNHCSLVERWNIVNIRTPEPLHGRGIDIITVARGWLQTISGWCDLWWCATVQPRICATNATLQHTETTEGWLPSKRIETFCSATGIKCELSCNSWYHWLRVEQIEM